MHRKKLKQTVVDLMGGRCVVCGYDRCIRNMHLHHYDKLTKSFNFSSSLCLSTLEILTEAQKCILLCANCHGKLKAT